MPLQKQPININFAQGLDLKTDPFQVSPGKMLTLVNMVFTKGGLLTKRYGNVSLTSLPDTTYKYLTTFNRNLVAIGKNLEAYSIPNQTWLNQGMLQPIQLSVLPLIRSNTNQTEVDSAIASNGFLCTVYNDSVDGALNFRYAVIDSSTGQSIVAPTVIPGPNFSAPRVFVLGNYFVLVFTAVITGTAHLQYFSVSTSTPTVTTGPVDISLNALDPGGNQPYFDGVVASNNLYLAWRGNDGGGAIRMNYLDPNLVLHTETAFAGFDGRSFGVSADTTQGSPIIWVAFADQVGNRGFVLAVSSALVTVLAPTQIYSAIANVTNMTSAAQNAVCTVFFEVSHQYTYQIASQGYNNNFIEKVSITQAGSVGAVSKFASNIGLASKAFINAGIIYMLTTFDDGTALGYFPPVQAFQPTYFLVDSSFNVIAKLAYSNGGGYVNIGPLSSPNLYNSRIYIAYLFKDLIQAVNKAQGVASAAGVYSQTGVNLASFTFTPATISTVEIGSDLLVSGGIIWNYDGSAAVEQNFHVWPNPIKVAPAATGGGLKNQSYFYQVTYEWSDNQGNIFRSAPSTPMAADSTSLTPSTITFTSTFAKGANTITVSSVTNLFVGQVITDVTTAANIAIGTSITAINGLILTLSVPTAGASGAPDTLQTVYSISNVLSIPTLHLTYKTANPVKIVIYRWSTVQQTYYQVTSVASPLLNDLTVDFVTFTDKSGDAAILGNNILYTTGGVVEDIGPPASTILNLYRSRVFLVDSEDRNLLWFSKQVIEATPVEMSDLFTYYVAPTLGVTQGNTGPVTALSTLDDKQIIFKRNAIYYMIGNGPDNTGANNDFSEPVFITATVGCSNPKSIVYMPQGLMFQSSKGIYLLGRDLSINYVGAAVEAYNAATVLSSINIPSSNEVRFILNSGITLKYDYFYGQWGTDQGTASISSTLYQNLHTYLTSLGTVFQEAPGIYADGVNPVLMSFTTSWIHLAGLQGYQRAYFFYLLATYLSPHKLSIQIAYDYNPTPQQSMTITPDNSSAAYGGDPLFGDGASFGGATSLEQWQVFFNQQKCEAFQLTVTEIFDASLTSIPGAGLSISGLDLVIGAKGAYPRLKASRSIS